MRRMEFRPASFDLIWCEGASFVIGFETGLREWRRLLVPGGCLAVTEACWTRPSPPVECLAFWMQEYPSIRNVSAMLDVIAVCGYEVAGHFTLPPSSWWDDYYRPLYQNINEFRVRHRGDQLADEMTERIQREIDIWHAYSNFYSYELFVLRAGN